MSKIGLKSYPEGTIEVYLKYARVRKAYLLYFYN